MSKTYDLGAVTAYAIAVENGYEGTEEQFAAEMTGAAESARDAAQDALDAEAYAIGTRNGTAVSSTDPAYHNNSKYFSEQGITAVSVAPAYSASSTYAVGDPVTYNNKLYVCSTPITTAEAWTAAHWTETSIGSQISDLKDDLSKLAIQPVVLMRGQAYFDSDSCTFDIVEKDGTQTVEFTTPGMSYGNDRYNNFVPILLANAHLDWSQYKTTIGGLGVIILININERKLYWYVNSSIDPLNLTNRIDNEFGSWYRLCTFWKGNIHIEGNVRPDTWFLNGVDITLNSVIEEIEEEEINKGLLKTTGMIFGGRVDYYPALYKIKFTKCYVGPIDRLEEGSSQYAAGYGSIAYIVNGELEWSSVEASKRGYAKYILYNTKTGQLIWYDRPSISPDQDELVLSNRDEWLFLCFCWKKSIHTNYRCNKNVFYVNGVDITEVDWEQDSAIKMYLKGQSQKTFGKSTAIICAGQSNAVGSTPMSQLPSYITFPVQNVTICKDETGVFKELTLANYTDKNKFGFDLVTYYYASVVDNNNIKVIKTAMGGTSIAPPKPSSYSQYSWTPFYEVLDTIDHSLLYMLEKNVRNCIENNDINIGAVIWHQGESDDADYSEEFALNYYRNFLYMIAYIRGIVSNPNLPFICGTVPTSSNAYDETVDEAIRRIANDDSNVYLVDLADAQTYDGLHFTGAWDEYFGKKVHDYLIDAKVITGTKLNPSKPT